jgi:hypothetical protein
MVRKKKLEESQISPDKLTIDDLNNIKIEIKPEKVEEKKEEKKEEKINKIDMGNIFNDVNTVSNDKVDADKLKKLKEMAAKTAMTFEKALYRYASGNSIESEEEVMLHETWKMLCNEFITDGNSGRIMTIMMFVTAHGGFWFVHLDEIKTNMQKRNASKKKEEVTEVKTEVKKTETKTEQKDTSMRKTAPVPPSS